MINSVAIIPAYNEGNHIAEVVKATRDLVDKVIVVDDGSTDSTALIARKAGAIVLRHIVNLGKGAALKTGCEYAYKIGAKFFILLDADIQHEPNEIPRFLKLLNDYDIVFSYRKLNKNMPLVIRVGNFIITKITKLLYGISLKDTQSGYRAFTREAYKKIKWKSSDYSVESEVIARVGKSKLRYTEIPIKTIYSDKYKGTTVLDGIKIVLNMIWWRFTEK